MSVLAQAFLTLVRGHLVPLMLLSVRHNIYNLKGLRFFAHLGDEGLGRLEGGNIVGGDHDGRVLGDVPGRFLRAGLHREAAEATEIDVFTIGQRVFHAFHEAFHNALHLNSFNASAFGDFVYNFSFSHNNNVYFKYQSVESLFQGVAKIGLFF